MPTTAVDTYNPLKRLLLLARLLPCKLWYLLTQFVFLHIPALTAAYLYDHGPCYGRRVVQPRDQEPGRLCHGDGDKENAYQHAQRGEINIDNFVILATDAIFDGFVGTSGAEKTIIV